MMEVQQNISLKNFNTFGIDVKAKSFVEIVSASELKEVLSFSQFKNADKLILGGGSNILLTKNYDGLTLIISIPGIKIIDENESKVLVEAGAGVIWNDLVMYCVGKNFGGIENLSLIPGTAGAAPMQNIGAYGQEVKEVFYSLNGIQIDDLKERTFYKEDCKFGYRDRIFKSELKEKFIITSVTLRLDKNPNVNLSYDSVKNEIDKMNLKNISIRDVSKVVCEIRKRKLPNPAEIGNAGSFFKNPVVDKEKFLEIQKDYPDVVGYSLDNGSKKIAAGWLIEKCGWKGKRIGNTGAHSKQSLVLVNYGNATGSEILELAEKIKSSVWNKFEITLQNEVNIY